MSWYPPTELDEKTYTYLKLLQEVYKVRNSEGKWIVYKLQPHQIHWHSEDIAIRGKEAKIRVVKKSRNTSFTTSSIISLITAITKYPKQIIPVVRLGQTRANDLIEEIKEIIRHMTPIRIEGKLWPFNPAEVNMEKIGSIIFPNGTEIRAFPANSHSAETIRGLRITGHAGIIDEANFMISYDRLYTALRDTKTAGDAPFQIDIGTTLKGVTKFSTWLEKIEKEKPEDIIIFDWPVFPRESVDLQKPLTTQTHLKPIVPWHKIEDLENKRKSDLKSFKEEYMAMTVDADDAYYSLKEIMERVNEKLKNKDYFEELHWYFIGVDPAGEGDDYASISVFGFNGEKYRQAFLYYEKKTLLSDFKNKIKELIEFYKPKRVRIDANGLGYQLGQDLRKEYGAIIELIKGSTRIKNRRVPILLKEFLHTNMMRLISENKVEFLDDEIMIKQYSLFNNRFEAVHHPELGHGDSVISNGLALLPEGWRFGKVEQEFKSKVVEEIDDFDSIKKKVEKFVKNGSFKEKKKFYSRI